jgi:hypothetical protein
MMNMIQAMLGIFIVLASFCMGYWLRDMQVAVQSEKLEKEMQATARKSTRPKFEHKTPFTSILKDDEKKGKGR